MKPCNHIVSLAAPTLNKPSGCTTGKCGNGGLQGERAVSHSHSPPYPKMDLEYGKDKIVLLYPHIASLVINFKLLSVISFFSHFYPDSRTAWYCEMLRVCISNTCNRLTLAAIYILKLHVQKNTAGQLSFHM